MFPEDGAMPAALGLSVPRVPYAVETAAPAMITCRVDSVTDRLCCMHTEAELGKEMEKRETNT